MRGKTRAVAVVVLLVGFVVVLWLRGSHGTTPTEEFVRPSAVYATPNSSPLTPETVNVTQDAEAETLARAAVTAWQNPDPNVRQAQLQPLVIPELLALYAYTDPTEVPSSPVDTVTTRDYGEGSTSLDVKLADGTALTVTVEDVNADGHPLVTSINAA